MNHSELEEMKGQVFAEVRADDEEMTFTLSNGDQYKFYHSQDCCESVFIEDIDGDLSDLEGKPLLVCEEISSEAFEESWEAGFTEGQGWLRKDKDGNCFPDSYTWTFYKFATIKGYVTVRWLGESNGCYSESVDMNKMVNGRWQRRW